MDVDTNDFEFDYYMDHVMDYSPEEQQMDTYIGWSQYDPAEEM
jgi:hypothetical protein